VTLPESGGTVNFKYDPLGRRIEKVAPSGTTVYAYDGDNVVEELGGGGNLLAHYTQGSGIDEPLALTEAGGTYFYHADGLGSITSMTDLTGNMAASYVYDSFGNQTASTGTITNPFQYTAREFDSETGLYYYRARYYDPQVGRLMSEDPIRFDGGMNFYRYVLNRPVNYVDPDGRAVCFFNVGAGRLVCYDNSLAGPPLLDIPVASGNNGGGTQCKNNQACESKPNRGPIPSGWWYWTNDYTGKPNGKVLAPAPGTNTLGRDLFRSHSCQNAFGPSLSAPFCSTGCITGSVEDIKALNRLLDSQPWNSLNVGDGITDSERFRILNNRHESRSGTLAP
jgi:RHS repeat-associated protein